MTARTTGAREAGARRRERVAAISVALRERYPKGGTALRHRDAFQLLVATILSAQCTDERVNALTPGLFARYPTAAAFAAADRAELEEAVKPAGFFRNKARSIQEMSSILLARHGSMVPRSMAEMVRLPGVGRKTANVVLWNSVPEVAARDPDIGIVVDTHVGRLARRLGLSAHEDPEKVEADLMALVPREDWAGFADRLIFHGRETCTARAPACERCTLLAFCPRIGVALAPTSNTRGRK
ncbi:MAG: endonuclease III [Actinomycetota bacterium]